MVSPLLNIEDLSTHLFLQTGTAKVVDCVTLTIAKGETLALVGESGSGKTMTAYSILRLVPSPPGRIVGGRVLFEGMDLLTLPEKEMRKLRGNKISMVFQEPLASLNPVFRVGEQIAEVLRVHLHKKKRDAIACAINLLNDAGIPSPEEIVRNYPHQLSGGMLQRVMIAMALACGPELIIADEPTTALDVTIQAQIMDLLQTLVEKKRMALLLITHDLGVVAETAQSVAVMYAGRIMEYCDVETLFKNPLNPYTEGLLRSLPHGGGKLRTIRGMVPPLVDLPIGCRFSTRCDHAFDRCFEEEPGLFNVSGKSAEKHLVRCWLRQGGDSDCRQ